jgi:cell division protein FtsB
MLLVLLVPMIWLSILGIGLYFAARLVRAFERRGAEPAGFEELRQRVTQLEDNLDAARDEIARLHDGHEFTTRLLTERAEQRRE